jgi:hypothetical protein
MAGEVASLTGVPSLQRDAIYNAYQQGLFISTASGNIDPCQHDLWDIFPAGFRHMVVGVTAIGCDGSKEQSFPDGERISLSAPGHADDHSVDDHGLPQIVTTALGGGFLVADNELFSGTSAAVPHVGAVAALALSHTPSLTNDDLRALLQHTAMDLGTSGYDLRFGHGLVRADGALAALDSFIVVHDSTSQFGGTTLLHPCRTQYFKNVTLLHNPPVQINDDWSTWKVKVYEFQKTVSLAENTNPNHIPLIWTRGRQCIAARDTVSYDGRFEPYFAWVEDVDHAHATIKGCTYKVFRGCSACQADSFVGWFPINPNTASFSTVFSYTYLADTTSQARLARNAWRSVGGCRVSWHNGGAGDKVTVRFLSPIGQGGELAIYDVAGRLRRRFEIPAGEGGWREISWDRADQRGKQLASGIYFGRLKIGRVRSDTRVLILR